MSHNPKLKIKRKDIQENNNSQAWEITQIINATRDSISGHSEAYCMIMHHLPSVELENKDHGRWQRSI